MTTFGLPLMAKTPHRQPMASAPRTYDAPDEGIAGPTHTGIDEIELDVLFVCSSGGHLAQLISSREWWSTQRVRWVTFRTADAISKLKDEDVLWAHYPTTRNFGNAVRNLGLAVRTLRAGHTDVVVSNGAGVAFPFFVVAWLMRIPTVYIEVFDRVESPTLTGRLCRPFTTEFCVQWPEQQLLYPGARLIGHLL